MTKATFITADADGNYSGDTPLIKLFVNLFSHIKS